MRNICIPKNYSTLKGLLDFDLHKCKMDIRKRKQRVKRGIETMRRKETTMTQKKGFAKKLREQWQWYLLLAPSLVYLFIFNYVPLYGIQISFRQFRPSRGIWGSDWVGLKFFKQFMNYAGFETIMRNTIAISLYALCTFPLSCIFALMLNEIRNLRYKKVLQTVSYAPYFISTTIVCAMLQLFFGRSNGLVNNVIALLGGTRIPFLEKPNLFYSMYVWSDVWQGLGFGAIIYLAALSGISPDLYEAAKIDGASRLQCIRYINIPSIMPTIIINLILRCGSLLGVGFEKTYLLQNPLNLEASQVISTYVYEIGLHSGQYSYSAAIGLFNTVVNLIMLFIVNKIAKTVSDISLW